MSTIEELVKRHVLVYDLVGFAVAHSLNPAQAYRLIRKGDIPAKTIGGQVYITTEDAEAWRKALPSYPVKDR